MNTLRTVVLSGLCLTLVLSTAVRVHAQTADELIAKHIEALGGKAKLLAVHSLYQEGTAVMANGAEISTKTWRVQGKLYRQEIDFGMGTIVIIATPTQGWASNPRNGGEFKALPADQLSALQTQMDPADPFVDYAAKGNKVELSGKDTVGNVECTRLKVTYPSGQSVTYSLDPKTYYILRESRTGGGTMGGGAGNGSRRGGNGSGEMRIDLSDYKKTPDGYLFPYTMVLGGIGAKTSVTKLEINGSVDVAGLSQPK